MARGVNRVFLIGNLGKDPEVRYLPSGGAVASTSLATSESWKDKQTGEKQERVEWHNLNFFGRLAEVAGEYLKKGSKVYIEGSIRTEKWQDKDTGADRFSTDIVADQLQMLGGREDSGGGNDGGFSGQDSQQGQHRQQQSRQGGRPAQDRPAAPRAAAPAANLADMDDDIPFD